VDGQGGYVKFYRSVESSEDFVGLRPDQCWVAARIVQLANYKPGFHRFRGQAIPVGRGELAHTLETIASRTGATIKVVRTTVARLVQSGFLGTRTGTVAGTAYRILIVRNYERYQGDEPEPGTEPGTVAGSDRARTGHGPGTDRALRERREEGKKEDSAPAPQALPLSAVASTEGDTTPAAPPATAPGAKPAPERRTDARVSPLTAAMASAYEQERGDKYLHGGAKDATALKRLLSVADGEEIIRRWRLALRDEGFHRCDSFAQLAQSNHWNHYARGTTQGPRSLRKLTA
jgi:hypothetical protein